jgi:hypothetical protein
MWNGNLEWELVAIAEREARLRPSQRRREELGTPSLRDLLRQAISTFRKQRVAASQGNAGSGMTLPDPMTVGRVLEFERSAERRASVAQSTPVVLLRRGSTA